MLMLQPVPLRFFVLDESRRKRTGHNQIALVPAGFNPQLGPVREDPRGFSRWEDRLNEQVIQAGLGVSSPGVQVAPGTLGPLEQRLKVKEK